ncbi:EF-hand calcium-binding domain-containing protein 14-like [Latimeria chalumnae]|uniref:EF-hand calcium-binding domain-containing protein 14-like n=1 Tax=Latimeria chalumnae TaxID=7897 RepID=UPI0003C165BE|nr:PREDICTED: EF-hand calcium-binding domain-containing protein 14-like [Latimeria chalumnae]|eukprot:XP_005998671.1 PREDICTED: EF-hand calcium-binding domain-containing protein 14-like [Latimeria chalumnae]
MECAKQEKYILLSEDSDLEEFDKAKVALMGDLQQVKAQRKTKKRQASWGLQCVCYIFVLLLIISQVLLTLVVLKTYKELENMKNRQSTAQKAVEPSSHTAEQRSSDIQQLESKFNDLLQKCKELDSIIHTDAHQQEVPAKLDSILSQKVDGLNEKILSMGDEINRLSQELETFRSQNKAAKSYTKAGQEGEKPDTEIVPNFDEAAMLEVHMVKEEILQHRDLLSNFSLQILLVESNLHYLVEQDAKQNLAISGLDTMQEKLNNVTETVNNLQSQIEQELDSIFIQISQRKEETFLTETDSNYTNLSSFVVSTARTLTSPLSQRGEKVAIIPTQGQIRSQEQFHGDNEGSGGGSVEREATIKPSTAEAQTKAEEHEIDDEKQPLKLAFINSLSDLQTLFYRADENDDGYLTYEELMNDLRELTPEESKLKPFDEQNDDKYSFMELMYAFSLRG